ncbi:TPR repeat-containing protein DDB_G0287407-like [Tubulanus polymorphus]|uniref:TPR repeat-containing protein DDB_G0287407-like n=1 Tax=Tubulanus polymorphus TaxID=672921 RepID=UPI003DA37641
MSVNDSLDVVTGDGEKMDLIVRRSGWKTVRIFVSSTFKDFMYEREVLVKEVFPDLRAWCESKQIHLLECDLRWGVPKDSTSEMILRMCLGEIDRCYADNIMPYFLNMTSERIGWIPDTEDIPGSLVDEYRWIFGLSMTEMEIIHGAFRKDNPNSLFLMRDDSFLDTVPLGHRHYFLDEHPLAPSKLKMLREMIANRFPSNRIVNYKCQFVKVDKERKIPILNLDENFRKSVFEFFKDRIERQYPLLDATEADIYQSQKEAVEAFMKQRSSIVLGRTDTIKTIKDHISGESTGVPLLLMGSAGSGKTSIIAKCVNDMIPFAAVNGVYRFYHFVGAVPGSTVLELTLKRLLIELRAVNDQTMPADLESTCQMVSGLLSNPNTKKTIIFIDALNQFDDNQFSTRLPWLPTNLSKNVKVILSMINDTPPHVTLLKRAKKPIQVQVRALSLQVRKDIIKEVLGEYNKQLDLDQMINLLSKENSANPLWLSLACEELRVFGDYRRILEKIDSMADTLPDLLSQILSRFEHENGGSLMVATLSLLEVAHRGLLESELLIVLADEDNLMPPSKSKEKGSKDSKRKEKQLYKEQLSAFKWATVYRALRKFLRPFGNSGEGRLDFYHRSLSKAVRKKYFKVTDENPEGDKDLYTWWRIKLCRFFAQTADIDRKIEEYPYQLMNLGYEEELVKFLSEWDTIDRLYHHDFSSELFFLWKPIGGKERMAEVYTANILNMENKAVKLKPIVLLKRYNQITNLLLQQGLYDEADQIRDQYHNYLINSPLKDDLVSKVHLYWTIVQILDGRQKLIEFIYRSSLPLMRSIISAIDDLLEVVRKIDGRKYKFLEGKALLSKAFTLSGISTCENSRAIAEEGLESVKLANQIFNEIKIEGLVAECVMTAAILQVNGSPKQKQLYDEAMEKSMICYGENSLLTARIFINRGIYYEESRDYYEAFNHFYSHYRIVKELYGEDHVKVSRAKNILMEPMFKRIANEKGIDISK